MEALIRDVDDLEWIRIDDSSAPGQVRRRAAAVAERIGFSEHRTGEVAIAATELATNVQRHAQAGTVVVRERRAGAESAVELLVADSGPGFLDIDAIARDGTSTGGTLGIGLGAAIRLASWFDAHSVPGRGTVMVATFWPAHPPVPRPSLGAIVRAFDGEPVCGDAWASRTHGDATLLLLADGLGHGALAAAASNQAVRAFLGAPLGQTPGELLRGLHGALRATRGAAAAVVRLDPALAALTFAGVGNIAVWIDDGEQRRGLPSAPGIVGHNARTFRDLTVALSPDATVVMHSDGLTTKWDLAAYPGLRAHDPLLVAATLMRDAGIHHDDASVVVMRAS
ncbi:MAG TPA: ATP-binding protein [Candidatus Elarobacter sp.]|nr:ATP-binding protein [Candidatus Elarobacter sp.]